MLQSMESQSLNNNEADSFAVLQKLTNLVKQLSSNKN